MTRRRGQRIALALAGLLLLASVVLVLVEARRRSSLYWYDVRADHRYEFAASPRTIALDATGVTVPAVADPASTAMLGLYVSSTAFGRWFEPALEISGPDGEIRTQYLERGARGLRWVDLTGLLDAGGRVELRGRHLKWEPQDAQWLVFDPPPLRTGPLLIIAPHPDDAEIAAFGLYSSHDSWIVTITSGHGADRRLAHLVADPRARGRLYGQMRAFDSVTVPRWGDVPPGRAVNLGYFTVTLDEMYADPLQVVADRILGNADIEPFRRLEGSGLLSDRQATSSWTSLVDDLIGILQTVRPSVIVTPDPRLDGAPDHKLSTIALIEALERVEPAGRTLLLYTNHHPQSEYFPFGPAQGWVGLPPWTAEPLWARGAWSHRLDETARIRKLVALEAQHDLRPPPRFVSASPARRALGELARTLGDLWRDPTDSYSYMRRGPRPNELFLVCEEGDGTRLREDVTEFLEALREGRATTTGDYRP